MEDKDSIGHAHSRLDKTDARLSRVEGDVHALRKGQETLSHNLDDVRKTMGAQHSEVMTALQARTTRTLGDVINVMQVIVYAGVIVGSVVTMIVYIAGNANGPKLALMEYKLERIFGETSWAATWKTSKPKEGE